MAYELLNGTRNCGELKPLEPNANRPLPSRPPPESWKPFQPTEAKRNKRERVNAPKIEYTYIALPTVPKTSKNISILRISPYENLPFILDPTSPFINALSINNTVSLSPSSMNCTNQTYLNVSPVKYSSRTKYSYSYSNTLLSTPSNFVFPISEQIASDITHFLVQATPLTSPNNLQLVVLKNMLIKHYKQSLISHIDLLLLVYQNRNYTTFETIIPSCIAHIGFRWIWIRS